MRMGLRTVCGANLRSLSGVLRPRDTLDREAASVASVFAGRMTTAMSCAHRHLSMLSLHFILIASFMHHYYLLRHTTNTHKYPCPWHFMHLKVYLASAFFVLPLLRIDCRGNLTIPENRRRVLRPRRVAMWYL